MIEIKGKEGTSLAEILGIATDVDVFQVSSAQALPEAISIIEAIGKCGNGACTVIRALGDSWNWKSCDCGMFVQFVRINRTLTVKGKCWGKH